jgi:prevent-host-death family protein
MRAVGIKTLKNKLSEYVRLAASGETVLVTDRDRVVAELVPPAPGRGQTLADAKLDEAVRRGWVTQPRQWLTPGPPPRGKPVMTLEELLRGLDESREDRV